MKHSLFRLTAPAFAVAAMLAGNVAAQENEAPNSGQRDTGALRSADALPIVEGQGYLREVKIERRKPAPVAKTESIFGFLPLAPLIGSIWAAAVAGALVGSPDSPG